MSEPWVVGRYYSVPVVRGTWRHHLRNWVVIGPGHEDTEIIGFPEYHFHLDPRFVSKQRWDAWSLQAILGGPVSEPTGSRCTVDWPRPRFVGLRKRRMIREVSPLEIRGLFAQAHWMFDLEERYRHESLRAGMVCPHRGTDLSTQPVDTQGCVTCPCHGLRWNATSGRLVPLVPQWVEDKVEALP